MKTNASANRWPTASLERFAHLPMCGEGTRWEIVEKIQCEMFPRLSFSPSCRWCRACFDWDERDPPIPSLLKPNDRAASVADGIQPKHPSAPWLDWPSPADHWNYSAVSSSFFFFPFVWEKTTFNVLWVYPSFPLFGRETITFEISPSGENTSGTDALKFTDKTSNAADVSKAWMCKRKKSWSKKIENNKISTTNDRLKSWWNPSGIIQPLPPLFLSTKACEEMPIKPKNLIIVKELRKMGNLLVFRLRDRLRIRSTWIHINIHIERERETHTITHEEKKSRISSSKNSSTAQCVCVCVFRLIVIVCCWRTSRCQATQRRATATLLLPSALAIQLGRAGRTEPNNIPPSCKPRVNPSPHPDVVLINKYKKKKNTETFKTSWIPRLLNNKFVALVLKPQITFVGIRYRIPLVDQQLFKILREEDNHPFRSQRSQQRTKSHSDGISDKNKRFLLSFEGAPLRLGRIDTLADAGVTSSERRPLFELFRPSPLFDGWPELHL